MQTVWSRVAQAQCVCKCPSCLLTTNAIARRTSIATARRTIRVGDVFTLSFSSLAAGLAFTDSMKKDDRRKQWDKVIEEARATVAETEIQQQRRLAALSDDSRRETLDNTRSSGYGVSTETAIEEVEAWDVQESEEQDHQDLIPYDRNDTWLDVFDWAQEQHRLREASGFQDWRGLPLSLLQSLSRAQLDELLSNERLLRRFYGGPDCNSLVDEQSRYPFSMKKIRTLEWSVARMVLKLLSYCSTKALEHQEDLRRPEQSLLDGVFKDRETIKSKLDHTRERLRILHAERRSRSYYEEFEPPQIPNYDDTIIEEYEQTSEMNISLQKLLELMKPEAHLSDLMSKICYNLLTARTPPNIHTYNMLLVRFCVLGNEDLVKAVLSSMRESHIRPNEITHATVLRHFTATGNRVGFVDYWRRIEGRRGGLALANPEQEIHPVVQERYLIFGKDNHKAAEKGRMNAQVYESLIVGALRFLGGQTAMHYYRSMISEGWSPSLGIFLAILQDCCRRLDWTLGQAILGQLEKSAERMNTLTYEWMLRLCQCCGQQDFFDQILRSGVQCGALPATMLDLPNHAKTDDVGFTIECAKDLQPRKTTGHLEKMAARMSYRLGDKSPFLMENFFHDFEEENTWQNTVNRMNDRWKARSALQQRLDVISTDIYFTVLEVNHALYASKHLSSVKFWLSTQVKHLEEELDQIAKGAALDSYGNMIDEKIQRARARTLNNEGDESSKLAGLSIAAGHPEKKDVSHLAPRYRQPGLVQWSQPKLPQMTSPSNGPFWKEAERQMAAMA